FAHANRAGPLRDCGGRSPGLRPLRFVSPAVPPRSDPPRSHRSGGRSDHVHGLSQMHRPLPRRRVGDGHGVTHDTDVLVIGAGPAGAVAAWGAKLRVGTEAAGMTCEPDGRWRVRLRGATGEETCRARVVIAADGVEAMVGRWAGLDTRVPARDMESCAQYVLEGCDFDPDALYLQFGDRIAPGGYA